MFGWLSPASLGILNSGTHSVALLQLLPEDVDSRFLAVGSGRLQFEVEALIREMAF